MGAVQANRMLILITISVLFLSASSMSVAQIVNHGMVDQHTANLSYFSNVNVTLIFSPYSQSLKLQVRDILLNMGITNIEERTIEAINSVSNKTIVILDGGIISEILLFYPRYSRKAIFKTIHGFFVKRNLPVLYFSIGENYFILKKIVGYLPTTNTSIGSDTSPTIYGLKIYPNNGEPNDSTNFLYKCSELYEFSDNLYHSLDASINWALRKMNSNLPEYQTATVNANKFSEASAPYWQFMSEVEVNKEFYPYGRFNIIKDVYKLVNDGSSTYDWRIFTIKSQTRPGYDIWSNDWRNNRIWTYFDAGGNSHFQLTDYAPTTTSGTSSVTVSIGVTAGVNGARVTAGFSYSYSISDVQVLDHSDFSTEEASWEHVIDSTKNVGKYTYYCKPGLQVRLPDGWSFAAAGYDKVRYAKWSPWGFWYYWDSGEINWIYNEVSNPPWSGA